MGWRDAITNQIVKGIRAFHSSPHDFDRFDASKIGTGEGAQVYGHGLYFAENPNISGQGGSYWQQFRSRFSGPELEAAKFLSRHNFDRNAAVGDIERWQHLYSPEDYRSMMDMLRSGAPVGPRTYEVNINADPNAMLQWDRPMSDQAALLDRLHPNVKDALESFADERGVNSVLEAPEGWTGGQFYRQLKHYDVNESLPDELPGSSWLTGETTYPKHASAYLQSLDVPGIRYLDSGSRGKVNTATGGFTPAENPTHNYVMFDPANIDILRKYGIAAAPAGALGMGALADQSQYEAPQ